MANDTMTGKVDRQRYLSPSEVNKLLAFWRYHGQSHRQQDRLTLAVVSLALGSGVRASELSNLNLSDIDLQRSGLLVTRLKRRKPCKELIALSEGTINDLRAFIGDRSNSNEPLFNGKRGRIGRTGLWYIWKNALIKAGLPHYVLHASRHTVAMALYETTGDIRLVQQQLGHTTPAVTSLMYAWHTHGYMQRKLATMYEG